MVSENIKRFRGMLHWSQRELSKRAGITQAKLSRVEMGYNKLDTDELVRVAAAFGIEVSDLLAENPRITPKIVLEREGE